MCGGGGGGDGGAAERDAARQKRIEDATNAVNAIFGKGGNAAPPGWDRTFAVPGDGLSGRLMQRMAPQQHVTRAPTREDFTTVAASDPATDTTVRWGRRVGTTAAPRTMFDQAGYDAAMRQWNDSQNAYNSMNNAGAAREALYRQVGDDTRNYYSKQLAEDAADALRDKNFTQARAGTFGSSQAIDMQREFDRRNDRGLLDVANRADSASTNLRNADEKTRVDLISRIVNGLDQGSATDSALSQLRTNAEAASNNAQAGRMANVFSGAMDAWKAYNTGAGEEAARKAFESKYGNFFANNGGGNGYQGNVTG